MEKDNKFIVTPKTEKTVTITVRIDTETNNKLENVAFKSSRSRNEIINKALKFALDNMEFVEN
ncbi:MAG: ribbon-helix-helix domain-containing protein [Ruminococcus sp.]|jgi:predicted transcriptional regulator|nr:ribbon-helix-helix domain-containing protein [Ruminococcus sp.]